MSSFCPDDDHGPSSFPALHCVRCGQPIGELSADHGQLILSRTVGDPEAACFAVRVAGRQVVLQDQVQTDMLGRPVRVELRTADNQTLFIPVGDVLHAARAGVEVVTAEAR